MHLETERLQLRLMQATDIPALVQIWTDPAATRYMGGVREEAPLIENLEQDVRDQPTATYEMWPVIEKASKQLIGHCGLLDKEIEGQIQIELVYIFIPSAWGKGYATEIALALKAYAQTALGLRRLVALIKPENVASMRVAVKVGMALEKEIIRPGGAVMHLYGVNMAGQDN